MKKTMIILFVLLGSAVLNQSCKKDNNYTMTNQDFVTQASSSNNFEIAAGNLAITKGVSDSVVMFGHHMITDHGKTAVEMATMAKQKGWTINASLLEKDQVNLNTLSGLSGTDFDKQFAAIMVTSHQTTIALFQKAGSSNGVPDADLRVYANAKLPVLQMHLTDAMALQAYVNH